MKARRQATTTKNAGRSRREPLLRQELDTGVYTFRYDDRARVTNLVRPETMIYGVPARPSRREQRLRATTGREASGNGN